MQGKLIEFQGSKLLAACDSELIGRKIEQGDLFLEVKEEFYGGNKISAEELEEMIDKAENINLLGKEAVGVALNKGVAHKEDVKVIAGIEHLQVYKLR